MEVHDLEAGNDGVREGMDGPGGWGTVVPGSRALFQVLAPPLSTQHTRVSSPENVFLGSHLSPRMQPPHGRPARHVFEVPLMAGPALRVLAGLPALAPSNTAH